jgi:mannose-6-phosphate isomerase-like protein (cupin superfamily)
MRFSIIKADSAPRVPLDRGRGYSIRLVDGERGTDKIDVHINVLAPNGAQGRVHRHTVSDNVYIVKSGEGELTVEEEVHRIVADDVVFIEAGQRHSLSNISSAELVLYEIYAPAGAAFDFVVEA